MKNKTISIFALLLVLSINTGYSVPWCHHGTIVQIQNVNWSQASILANYPGTIPVWMPDHGITGMSMDNYATSFAGGGGSIGGYTVPGSGQVLALAYSPSSYTSGNNYSISQGVQFKLNKCYTIAPMVAIKDFAVELPGINPDGPVIGVTYGPLEGIEPMCQYWSESKVTDPDEDEDFDGEIVAGENDVTIYLSKADSTYCR